MDILVVFGLFCNDADLQKAHRLRAIVVLSLAMEGIDTNAAMRRGVAVANGRVAENLESVAEAITMLMLMAVHKVDAAERRLRDSNSPPARHARMLKGRTIGLIGALKRHR